MQIHSQEYSTPADFLGKRVMVVGGGNSGAQIVADLTQPGSSVANVTWATLEPPTFLPDDIDGRYLFEQATARYKAQQEGRTPDMPLGLGDIVMVPPVKAARDEDAIIWATGFRPALNHLKPLQILNEHDKVELTGEAETRSLHVPNLWLVGYGNWTGYASATLVGVGRSARATVQEVQAALAG